MKGIPWTMLKEYIHYSKHTRIIIATIPADIFTLIQTKGTETSVGSRVWKATGFMGPLKLTIASENDLRINNTPNYKPAKPTKPKPQKPQKSTITTPQSSPTNTLTPFALEPEVETSSDVEISPEKPLLLGTNPMLSEAVGSMSPLNVAMNSIVVSNEDDNDDLEESENTQEEEMDYGLLTSPNPTDTDEFSASWADQC